jgi:uncharacterized membrane protein (DUF4010 family)
MPLMGQDELFYRFGVALAIGFLIGLEREYAQGDREEGLFAGIRTFPIIGLLGCTAALLADWMAMPWLLPAIFIGLSGLTIMAYYGNIQAGRMGLTTEVAALLTLLIGALCYLGLISLAVALGVIITVLLSIKRDLHRFIRHITHEDIYATLKFAVITAIILPLLPNESLGPPPLDVLNPYRIWLMVVLISGISFMGYLLIKLVGPRQGIGLSGLLGGLVSSTAVTLSFSQRSRPQPKLAIPLAVAITVSWTTMFLRVLVIVVALNTQLLQTLWLPLSISAAAGLAWCLYLYISDRTDETGDIRFSNPFELGMAIKFGLFYGVILVFSQTAQIYLGETGVYLSSIVAGLVDLNAISLSLAHLSLPLGSLDTRLVARAIMMAAMANTAVKGGIVLFTGSPELRRATLPGLAAMLAAGAVAIFLI